MFSDEQRQTIGQALRDRGHINCTTCDGPETDVAPWSAVLTEYGPAPAKQLELVVVTCLRCARVELFAAQPLLV